MKNKVFMNPWIITTKAYQDMSEIEINLINRNTGETKQVSFTVDELNTYIEGQSNVEKQ